MLNVGYPDEFKKCKSVCPLRFMQYLRAQEFKALIPLRLFHIIWLMTFPVFLDELIYKLYVCKGYTIWPDLMQRPINLEDH